MADLRSKFIEDYAGGLLNVSRQELASTGEVLSQDGFLSDATLFVEDGSGTKSGLKLAKALCEVVDPTTDEGAVNVRYANRTYASIRDLKIFSTAIASAQAALADASSTSITNLENAFQLLEDSQDTLSNRFETRNEKVDEQLNKLDKITELEESFETLSATVTTVDAKIEAKTVDINSNKLNITSVLSEFAKGQSGSGTDLEKAIKSIETIKSQSSIDLQNLTEGIVLRTDNTNQDSDSTKIKSLTFKGFNSIEYKPCAEIYSEIDDPTVYDPDDSTTHGMPGSLHFSVTKQGGTNPVQRMRIDQQGAFAFKSTTSCLFVGSEAGNVNTAAVFTGMHTSTGFGLGVITSQILNNGGVANIQANDVNLSDRREKKNIEPLEATWDRVKSWEIKKFHYNSDEDSDNKKYGVIAQEVQQTCPELFTTWNNDKLGVKEQQMDWMAIKALQEAQLKIEQLETKVAALEAAAEA